MILALDAVVAAYRGKNFDVVSAIKVVADKLCRRLTGGAACDSPNLGLISLLRVIAVSALRQFWDKHPDAEQPIKAWVDEIAKAQWTQRADIKAHYRSASILKNRRVVFNTN